MYTSSVVLDRVGAGVTTAEAGSGASGLAGLSRGLRSGVTSRGRTIELGTNFRGAIPITPGGH